MTSTQYFNQAVETLPRDDIEAMVDEKIAYTIRYAAEKSPFYRHYFRDNAVKPVDIRTHEDLLELPVLSGQTIRDNQPPAAQEFLFRSTSWNNIFTIHETSGTSGVPKSFFLTWDDWNRYAIKYARIFTSQGFSDKDRLIICASYGMNVGANTMTLAAQKMHMTIIPTGKCTFPLRLIQSYKPTGIVGSVFKFIRLARRMSAEGLKPADSSLERLIIGGESFSERSRQYVADIYDCEVLNTYGSTEGTMCGECQAVNGLHVPEDMVHMDIYDPYKKTYIPEGKPGHIILTTLLEPNETIGTLLINYDTDDTTRVLSKSRCTCGRTHMRIENPWREAETIRIFEVPVNRIDIEDAVFTEGNMEFLTGEYEAFVYGDEEHENVLRISVETLDLKGVSCTSIQDTIIDSFLKEKKELEPMYADESLQIIINCVGPSGLELYHVRGRPKRLVDRR